MNAEDVFDFLKFFVPLAGAAIAWFVNERRKRSAEEYERKERKYAALIDSLQGFYVTAQPDTARELKAQFLRELNNCWLYCPDEVIRKAYAFLATVHTGATSTDEVKERLVGELILAIRKDLLSRSPVRATELTARGQLVTPSRMPNNRLEFARVARPTRKSESALLAAQPER